MKIPIDPSLVKSIEIDQGLPFRWEPEVSTTLTPPQRTLLIEFLDGTTYRSNLFGCVWNESKTPEKTSDRTPCLLEEVLSKPMKEYSDALADAMGICGCSKRRGDRGENQSDD